MSAEIASDRLLRPEEVADLLGCSKAYVYAQARAGKLPFVPVGRNVRFRGASIEQWIRDAECGEGAGNGA